MRIEQLIEIGRHLRSLLGGSGVWSKPRRFSASPGRVAPADVLGVCNDADLDGLVFAGCWHARFTLYRSRVENRGWHTPKVSGVKC